MKKVFIAIIYFMVAVLLGILWYYPIVPYLFYVTAADDAMRDQMRGDLLEFYGIAGEIQRGDTGYPSPAAEKISVVMGWMGMQGLWFFPLLGTSLGLWRVLPYRKQLMVATAAL